MVYLLINETSLNNTVYWSPTERTFGLLYYASAFILGTLGNIFVIYTTFKILSKSQDKRTVMLIRYLAFFDLVCILIMYTLGFINLYNHTKYPFSKESCVVLGLFELYFPTARNYFVLALVAMKVAMIDNPFLSLSESMRSVHLIGVGVIVSGFILPAGPFYGLLTYVYDPKRCLCTADFYPEELSKQIFMMSATVLTVVVPLIAITTLSIMLLQKIKKMTKGNVAGKSVRVILLIVLTYFVCWSAFFIVFCATFILQGEELIPKSFMFWSKAILMTMSAINPFICIYSNKPIQKLFIMNCLPKWLRKKTDIGIMSITETSHFANKDMTVGNIIYVN